MVDWIRELDLPPSMTLTTRADLLFVAAERPSFAAFVVAGKTDVLL